MDSGDKIDTRTAVLILLSISFGVGYLFLPLSFFVQETLFCKFIMNDLYLASFLLVFNLISGFIAVYMLMDLRAQTNLG